MVLRKVQNIKSIVYIIVNQNISPMNYLPKSEQKSEFVQKLFNNIASKYDLMNDLITLGLHKLWKKEIAESLLMKNNISAIRILDLCCGTGDLTCILAKTYPKAEIIGLDFSHQMLEIAENRKVQENTHNTIFTEGSALDLPFANNYFDGITISFGLRNVSDYRKCLSEILRVCKPESKLIILDLSHPTGFWHYISYPYRFWLLPALGQLLTKNYKAYDYLPNSIKTYPNQEQLNNLLQEVGWQTTNYKNIFGGIVCIHSGIK